MECLQALVFSFVTQPEAAARLIHVSVHCSSSPIMWNALCHVTLRCLESTPEWQDKGPKTNVQVVFTVALYSKYGAMG